MGILKDKNIERVRHYTPLQYLPFIARAGSLFNKPALHRAGFSQNHLRPKSYKQDVERGFGDYVHLTLNREPKILKAKLAAGLPHVEICLPVDAIEAVTFNLCRFNVAKARQSKLEEKRRFPESATNGRYYPGHRLPIARSDDDKMAMLEKHLPTDMIEVLVSENLTLPPNTEIVCFSKADEIKAKEIMTRFNRPWLTTYREPPSLYVFRPDHWAAVDAFISRAISEPEWRGNGLVFD